MQFCNSQVFVASVIAACCIGCGANSTPVGPAPKVDTRIAEQWISNPQSDWPQIVLTNDAEFIGHTSLKGASGFLIEADNGRVFAATAAHLIGEAGGVKPEIPISQLTPRIKSWRLFPRTLPDSYVEATSVGVQGLDRPSLDWLILAIKESDTLPAHPLKPRKEIVRVGETIHLLGCPYAEGSCTQNVYSGTVTQRSSGDCFRYDLSPPVDIRGFSGAPIIDNKGFVVGVMTVWFQPRMSGDNFLEAGGEDVASIYDLLQSAR